MRHGKISGGLVATRQVISSAHETDAEVYAGYDLTPQLHVEAQVIDAVINTDAHLAWGLDAAYALPSGIFVQAGLARIDSMDHALVDVGLGYRF